MGCSVSLQHMARGGRRVARLVLINGPIRLARTEDDSFPWSMTEEVLEAYFADMEQHWPSKEREFITDSLYRARHRPRQRDLRDHAAGAARRRCSRSSAQQAKLDFRDLLPRIEVPVLAIYGRHDPYYPVELGEWIAEQCPRGEARDLRGERALPVHRGEGALRARSLAEFASR